MVKQALILYLKLKEFLPFFLHSSLVFMSLGAKVS